MSLNAFARKVLCSVCILHPFSATHVSHLEDTEEEELNRLLGIVVDVENLFMCVSKEEDADTKQVYFYLFKVSCADVRSCGNVLVQSS